MASNGTPYIITAENVAGQRELLRLFMDAANSGPFKPIDVIGAALGMAVEAHRRAAKNWPEAEAAFDQTTARAKQYLRDHFDAAGKKRPPPVILRPGMHS